MRINQSNLKLQNVSLICVKIMSTRVQEFPDANFGKGTCYFPLGSTAPSGPGIPDYWGFIFTLINTTLGRSPLDEWPARCRDCYLSAHNTHKRQTSMPQRGLNLQFQQANDRATIAIGGYLVHRSRLVVVLVSFSGQLPIYDYEIHECYSCSLFLCVLAIHDWSPVSLATV